MDSSEVITPVEEKDEATPTVEEGVVVSESVVEAEVVAAEQDAVPEEEAPEPAPVSMDASELLGEPEGQATLEFPADEVHLRAMLEALIYITEEPLTVDQIAAAIEQPKE